MCESQSEYATKHILEVLDRSQKITQNKDRVVCVSLRLECHVVVTLQAQSICQCLSRQVYTTEAINYKAVFP